MPKDMSGPEVFALSRQMAEELLGWLESPEASQLDHAALEGALDERGRQLLRRMFQDHLDLRAVRETRKEVVGSDGTAFGTVEAGHDRRLVTIFGEVRVERLGYRHRGRANLYPADGELNLPQEDHSYGLRHLAAIESTRGSFEGAAEAIERSTGQKIGKRQVEGLAFDAAADIDSFYVQRQGLAAADGDVLVLSCDGKGVVMRSEALREATAAAAAKTDHKLESRLSKGEKSNRKRMAEVAAVYDVKPVARSPEDIFSRPDRSQQPTAPKGTNKWVTASVVDDAAQVVADMFNEADRRDPQHQRTWIALVDGNNHQIDRIKAEARKRKVKITILIDIVHVLAYLWAAVWCFFPEGDPAAETWVRDRGLAILNGHAGRVATAIERKATLLGLSADRRTNADKCVTYLRNKRRYLNYSTALEAGWPIATGVIEGTCRHLVKDRMAITGARWGLNGAEAVLKLRALRTNGDFDEYLAYHFKQERHRNHLSRYANNALPKTA
jgi:hypothetical protein